MKSLGSINSSRGNAVERILAEKYNGVTSSHVGYDIEFEHFVLEVKSCLGWHVSYSQGKKCRHLGRYLVNTGCHENLKKVADAQGKMAVYAFIKIPRHDNGRIEEDSSKWLEKWLKWEHVDRLVKDPATRRIAKNSWHGWDITRYYYCIYFKYIFEEDKK